MLHIEMITMNNADISAKYYQELTPELSSFLKKERITAAN